MSSGQFDRVVAVCPVKRLGSLMDLSPFIDRFINRFGNRAILALSREAISLYRHRLYEAVKDQGAAIIPVDGDNIGILNQFARGRTAAFHIADDQATSKRAAREIRAINDHFTITTELAKRSLFDVGENGHYEFSLDFGHAVSDPDSVPCPIFMNSYLDALNIGLSADGQSKIPISDAKPLIWTAENDMAAADTFFEKEMLDPKRTVAVHLTANSYHPFRQILPKRIYFKTLRSLISKGYNPLIICGNLKTENPMNNKNRAVHEAFYRTLNSRAASFFYGDCLVQAEVIRRCAALLSPETGVAHLASAVGTPKVTMAADMFQTGYFLLTTEKDREFIARKTDLTPFDSSKERPSPRQLVQAVIEAAAKQ